MAIPVQKLRETQRPGSERLLEYLRDNSDKAFPAFELFCILNDVKPASADYVWAFATREQRQAVEHRIRSSLHQALEQGLVFSAEYQGQPHYAWSGEG